MGNLETFLSIAVAVITIISGLAAGMSWLVAAKLMPLEKTLVGYIDKFEVVICNNTEALSRLEAVITKHDEAIDDHAIRIERIETIHELNQCGSRKGGDR